MLDMATTITLGFNKRNQLAILGAIYIAKNTDMM